jgi:hypothetical protein
LWQTSVIIPITSEDGSNDFYENINEDEQDIVMEDQEALPIIIVVSGGIPR